MEDRAPQAADTQKSPKHGARIVSPWAIGLVLVALVVAWLWHDTRGRVDALRGDLGQRMRDIEADSRDARLSAKQAQEAMREALAKVAQLDLRLSEYQNHQSSLEGLYQELSRSRDDWVIADIEQILVIASQQLQLVGNVPLALAALQTVDARLARSGRAQFLPLRKAFARDIERLKAVPEVDIQGIAAELDQMIAGVDSLPLAQDMRPQAQAPEKAASEEGLWGKLGGEIANELRQLVKIQRMDGADAALLSPTQADFLRENLKLRLLNARIALLSRDEAVYRSDLDAAGTWLARYVDTRSAAAAPMAASLKQLRSMGSPLFPTMSESLAAVRAYKAPRERTPR
ncbi:MAG TPA: uroporphyrinogen-III C-methyltransferase [Burkholderiales bacterium]|nr:uroporphyrinogen-III C-methyltransferase [Burkholderiales bacterium]